MTAKRVIAVAGVLACMAAWLVGLWFLVTGNVLVGGAITIAGGLAMMVWLILTAPDERGQRRPSDLADPGLGSGIGALLDRLVP